MDLRFDVPTACACIKIVRGSVWVVWVCVLAWL